MWIKPWDWTGQPALETAVVNFDDLLPFPLAIGLKSPPSPWLITRGTDGKRPTWTSISVRPTNSVEMWLHNGPDTLSLRYISPSGQRAGIHSRQTTHFSATMKSPVGLFVSLLLLTTWCCVSVTGYSGGAPPAACGNMIPHHGKSPQEASPYEITTDRVRCDPAAFIQLVLLERAC